MNVIQEAPLRTKCDICVFITITGLIRYTTVSVWIVNSHHLDKLDICFCILHLCSCLTLYFWFAPSVFSKYHLNIVINNYLWGFIQVVFYPRYTIQIANINWKRACRIIIEPCYKTMTLQIMFLMHIFYGNNHTCITETVKSWI